MFATFDLVTPSLRHPDETFLVSSAAACTLQSLHHLPLKDHLVLKIVFSFKYVIAMPKVASVVRSRAKERDLLQQKIELEADPSMPACSQCAKAGAVCLIAPKLNRACGRCVRSGHSNECDAFMNEDECLARPYPGSFYVFSDFL